MLSKVQGIYFDTFVSILADCPHETLEKAIKLCEKFNLLFSRFEAQSDVSRLNNAVGKPVKIHPLTEALLRAADECTRLTDGAFDICTGAATKLWNFAEHSSPNPFALKLAAKNITGSISISPGMAQLASGHSIDLGGIAKGYIADKISCFLKENGVCSALINIGGDIAVLGSKPSGEAWRIGLQKPFGEFEKELWSTIDMQNEAIVTSGIDRRGFEENGKWAHHILDPKNGRPVENELLSVTVCCKSATKADAFATAFFVLGSEKGMEKALELGVDAVFLKNDGAALCTPDIAAKLTLIKQEKYIH